MDQDDELDELDELDALYGYFSGSCSPYLNSPDNDTIETAEAVPQEDVIKCECGAEKCGYNIHSDWCPKAVKP